VGELSVGEDLTQQLTDSSRSLADRVGFAEGLADEESPAVVRALIRVAQNPDVPEALSSAVGASLGRICFRRAQDVDELVMADFTGAAYISYDMEIGRLQRLAPNVKMRRAV
jgi:hypothetical protein